MVLGFILFTGLAIYFIISLIVIALAVSVARERGNSGWRGGLIAAVVMYMILFWDLIPMRVTHKYLCMAQGGFNVHKTLDEWKRENPGVAETLSPNESHEAITTNGLRRYMLNQRFTWDVHTSKHFLGIRKRDERIVDIKTNEILAQYIDFDSDQRQHNPESFRDFKIWIYTGSCEKGQKMHEKIKFNGFRNNVKNIRSVN